MIDRITAAVEKNAEEAREFLTDMIHFESTPGNETEVIHFCNGKFAQANLDCRLVQIADDISSDPEYSHSDTPMSYAGRFNLVADLHGTGGGQSVILQSHIDVVPAGDWEDAFEPFVEDGIIIGRGACDAKGQIATIWLAVKTLVDAGIQLKGDIQVQIVVEEECGGNGALALIRQGYTADAVVITEGTQLNIHPANRGAIWFRIRIEGSPCHMGRKHDGISAIDLSYKVIQALYEYEKLITADSANYPGFERYKNPVQVNVGMLNAGSWPATVAGEATIEGGVGFLPNRSMEQTKREMAEVIESIDDEWLKDHCTLDFPKLHNDSYQIDFSHPLVTTLEDACAETGLDSEVFGWNVSCDARLYAKLAGLPTVVFGPGSIVEAHAKGEKIEFEQITKAATALAAFLVRWCG